MTTSAFKTIGVVALGALAFAGCKPVDASADVVISTSMNRSGGTETHYAECGPNPTADTGQYRVEITPGQDYGGLPEGSPCPTGPREPMPQDQYPELYRQMSDAIQAPAPFAGGDIQTCGEWEADDPADARAMLAECPPLTKGELP